MNTKILAAVFALGIATTLGACGGSEPAASPSPSASTSPAMSPSPSPSK
jgi:ABC-type glycerol-3-phosphate transport system substrate-binding protein